MPGFDPNLATAIVYFVIGLIYAHRPHRQWMYMALAVMALLLAVFAFMKSDAARSTIPLFPPFPYEMIASAHPSSMLSLPVNHGNVPRAKGVA